LQHNYQIGLGQEVWGKSQSVRVIDIDIDQSIGWFAGKDPNVARFFKIRLNVPFLNLERRPSLDCRLLGLELDGNGRKAMVDVVANDVVININHRGDSPCKYVWLKNCGDWQSD
jgi:hypothetical protein